MKNNISAIFFSLSIVIASIFLGNSYVHKYKKEGKITVKGLGKKDFVSDLIVWSGTFSKEDIDLKRSYADLANDKEIITQYLIDKGINKNNIVFSAVNTRKQNKSLYSEDGKYIGDEFIGFTLTQSVQIESNEVEKVENISRMITELLNKGVQLYSNDPRYYYTKLSDLKIEMISRATEDARNRAENIAKNSGAELGELNSADMGVFQTVGQNSNESYSWGGTFNTSSKRKTASITMSLNYKVK